MTTATRIFIAIACSVTLLVLGAVATTAAFVQRAGHITVELDTGDGAGAVSIRVPAAFVRAAAAMVPTCALEEAGREIGPFLPAARAAVDELLRAPDVVLVEVDGREYVRVSKSGDTISVEVDADGNRVHVSIPLSTVSSVLEQLEAAAGRFDELDRVSA